MPVVKCYICKLCLYPRLINSQKALKCSWRKREGCVKDGEEERETSNNIFCALFPGFLISAARKKIPSTVTLLSTQAIIKHPERPTDFKTVWTQQGKLSQPMSSYADFLFSLRIPSNCCLLQDILLRQMLHGLLS